MKLFFSLLLMSMILSSEVCDVISVSESDNIIMLDTSFESESEKDASENIEDITEVQIKQNFHFSFLSIYNSNNDSSFRWPVSTSYLEVHSPPPELLFS